MVKRKKNAKLGEPGDLHYHHRTNTSSLWIILDDPGKNRYTECSRLNKEGSVMFL